MILFASILAFYATKLSFARVERQNSAFRDCYM